MKGMVFSPVEYVDAPSKSDGGSPWINPTSLSYEERRELLAEVRAGTLIAARFRARVFKDAPNVNKTRPEPGRLADLAATATGLPLQEGHWTSLHSVVGTLLGGSVEKFDGVDNLVIDHEITGPDALAPFIRGERRLFSISLRAERWTCSVCDARAQLSWWGPEFSCEHSFRNAELFGRGRMRMIHNAFVASPAVEGTAILAAYADAQEHGCALFGRAPRKSASFGEALAAILSEALDAKVEAGDLSRDVLVEEIATASEETVDRIEEILSGEGDLPTVDTLKVFSDTLDMDWEKVLDAFVEDGGERPEEEDEDDEDEDTGDPPTEEEPVPAENANNAALKALRIQLEAETKKRKAAELATFDASWKSAVADGRVLPTQRAEYDKIRESPLGLEFAQKMLSDAAPIAALSGKQTAGSNPPGDAKHGDEWALADLMVKHGRVRPAIVAALKAGVSPAKAAFAKD